MERLKAIEIFSKVKKFNEMASYFYQGGNKLTVTLSNSQCQKEHNFDSYKDFSKFVRSTYNDVLATLLLKGEWKHDGEYFMIEPMYNGYRKEFELYVHTK